MSRAGNDVKLQLEPHIREFSDKCVKVRFITSFAASHTHNF